MSTQTSALLSPVPDYRWNLQRKTCASVDIAITWHSHSWVTAVKPMGLSEVRIWPTTSNLWPREQLNHRRKLKPMGIAYTYTRVEFWPVLQLAWIREKANTNETETSSNTDTEMKINEKFMNQIWNFIQHRQWHYLYFQFTMSASLSQNLHSLITGPAETIDNSSGSKVCSLCWDYSPWHTRVTTVNKPIQTIKYLP